MSNLENTGCACKKSKCRMLYCNCFAGKRGCTSKCKCSGCQNQPCKEKSQPLKGVTKKKNIPKLLKNKIDIPNLSLPEGSKIIPKKRGRPPKKRLEEKENVSCGDNVNIKIEENDGHGAVHKVRGKRGNPRQFRNLMKELSKSVYDEDPDYVPVKRKYTRYMSLTPKTRKTTASSKRSRLADQTTVKKESPTEDSKIIEKGLKLSPFEVNSEFDDAELQLQLGDDSSSIDKEVYQELPVEEDMAKTHKDQSHLKSTSKSETLDDSKGSSDEKSKSSTDSSNISEEINHHVPIISENHERIDAVTSDSESDNTTETTLQDKTVNDECEIDDNLWNEIKEIDDIDAVMGPNSSNDSDSWNTLQLWMEQYF